MSQTTTANPIPEHVAQVMRKHSSLGSALKAGDADALRILLEYQRDKGSLENTVLDTALVKTAQFLRPELARMLLDFGASVGMRVEEQDAVQVALSAKNVALLKFFLEAGLAPVDHAENDGTTLLMAALQTEQFDLADYLIASGAEVNKKKLEFTGGGDTALHLASRQASFQAVLWLLEHGADPRIENAEGRQPSEEIPELDAQSAKQWDLDAMFNALEDLKDCLNSGQPFQIPDRLREMAHLEATPLSAAEAQMAAMAAQVEERAAENGLGLLPKQKKIGF